MGQLLKKTPLAFTKKVQENGDIYTFYFKPVKEFRHVAGQHAMLFVPGAGMHPFSLASAPSEDVMIATHVRDSKYKQALAALKPGDQIAMRGPILNFTLNGAKDTVVFRAQGIGITPFRSMLVDKKERKLNTKIILVHVDNGEHTFRKELEPIADESHFFASPAEFQAEATKLAKKFGANATFYISGAPAVVKSTAQLLKNNGVTDIKKDGFHGL
jgi:ferredoxin-NADP reductase